jgi:hypothetical protein
MQAVQHAPPSQQHIRRPIRLPVRHPTRLRVRLPLRLPRARQATTSTRLQALPHGVFPASLASTPTPTTPLIAPCAQAACTLCPVRLRAATALLASTTRPQARRAMTARRARTRCTPARRSACTALVASIRTRRCTLFATAALVASGQQERQPTLRACQCPLPIRLPIRLPARLSVRLPTLLPARLPIRLPTRLPARRPFHSQPAPKQSSDLHTSASRALLASTCHTTPLPSQATTLTPSRKLKAYATPATLVHPRTTVAVVVRLRLVDAT